MAFSVLSPLKADNHEPKAKHVILISCDGLRPDAVEFLGKKWAPNFYRLISEGAHTHNARTDFDYSITLPNHTSMLTGRGVTGEAGHAWTENSTPKLGQILHRNKKAYVASAFDIAHDHGIRTGLFSSKDKFVLYDLSYNERSGRPDSIGEDNGKDKLDFYHHNDKTEELIKTFTDSFSENSYGLSMLHLRDPDTSGHAHGWEISSKSIYMSAVAKMDWIVGKLFDFIEANENLKGKTALILTADHGGRLETKTHTKSDHKLNYTIPFYVWGAGVGAGLELYDINPSTRKNPAEKRPKYDSVEPQPIRNGDAGNLALYLLGLPAIDGSTINAKQDLKVKKPKEE
ncbi:MAG: hypothetical protein CMO38_05705 [Verrucomicrobiaceae bacterium]|nr:hypothetical protein [Verrucomicrobiaceae bacterium]|tara:strand:+ start:2552 stop:3583 length:1032 start_codon:yes stop_codon:yes gene_type:complete